MKEKVTKEQLTSWWINRHSKGKAIGTAVKIINNGPDEAWITAEFKEPREPLFIGDLGTVKEWFEDTKSAVVELKEEKVKGSLKKKEFVYGIKSFYPVDIELLPLKELCPKVFTSMEVSKLKSAKDLLVFLGSRTDKPIQVSNDPEEFYHEYRHAWITKDSLIIEDYRYPLGETPENAVKIAEKRLSELPPLEIFKGIHEKITAVHHRFKGNQGAINDAKSKISGLEAERREHEDKKLKALPHEAQLAEISKAFKAIKGFSDAHFTEAKRYFEGVTQYQRELPKVKSQLTLFTNSLKRLESSKDEIRDYREEYEALQRLIDDGVIVKVKMNKGRLSLVTQPLVFTDTSRGTGRYFMGKISILFHDGTCPLKDGCTGISIDPVSFIRDKWQHGFMNGEGAQYALDPEKCKFGCFGDAYEKNFRRLLGNGRVVECLILAIKYLTENGNIHHHKPFDHQHMSKPDEIKKCLIDDSYNEYMELIKKVDPKETDESEESEAESVK